VVHGQIAALDFAGRWGCRDERVERRRREHFRGRER
jgi:hypothetical protein